MAVGGCQDGIIAQAAAGRQDGLDAVAVGDICFASQPSIYKITRELKKESHTLFNCIHSIVSDASFIHEVRQLYPSLPLIANLRCGLWYTGPNPDGTCYFKSTDGHCNNWSFSTSRLNLNVATEAAKYGGCLIVDATRKGKRFPVSRFQQHGSAATSLLSWRQIPTNTFCSRQVSF